MPNINDAFPTRFLKAHDLQGREPIVTIAGVTFEPLGRNREMKPVVYFVGKQKGLKLNKTMATKMTELTGSPDTDQWVGVKVQLYQTVADFGGETYDVVRIREAVTQQAGQRPRAVPPPPPRPAAVVNGTPLDDDIGF
jgi:hypothetical protein